MQKVTLRSAPFFKLLSVPVRIKLALQALLVGEYKTPRKLICLVATVPIDSIPFIVKPSCWWAGESTVSWIFRVFHAITRFDNRDRYSDMARC